MEPIISPVFIYLIGISANEVIKSNLQDYIDIIVDGINKVKQNEITI